MNTVLYDPPGPRGRRRILIGSCVAGVFVLALIGLVVKRLSDQGQFASEKWSPLLNPGDPAFDQVWKLLLTGFRNTMTAFGLAVAFSLVLGTGLAILRLSLGRVSRLPVVGVIEVLRGLPVVIAIFFASRVLPQFGADLDPLWYLVIGLTGYNSVIIAEIVRAGVLALPRGQSEAAATIGLTQFQTMRSVLLPQAFRIMLPALISQLVVVLKDTSLVAVLGGYIELLRQGQLIIENLDNPIQVFVIVGSIYIVINYLLGRLAVAAERRLSRGRRQAAQEVTAAASTAGA